MPYMAKKYGQPMFSQRVWLPISDVFRAVVEKMGGGVSKAQSGLATEVALLMFCKAKRKEREKVAELLRAWKAGRWSPSADEIADMDRDEIDAMARIVERTTRIRSEPDEGRSSGAG